MLNRAPAQEGVMRDREDTIAWTMQYCQHYDPGGVTMVGGKAPSGVCKAGVNYLDQFGRAPDNPDHYLDGKYYPSSGIFQRICCTDGGKRSEDEQRARCPKWLRKTREMGEERADDLDASLRRMTAVGPIVKEFRKKPWGKQGVFDCPACGTGKLHLSQSSYNGHVWGKCTTPECVSWME
jgi:hypothetical protein